MKPAGQAAMAVGRATEPVGNTMILASAGSGKTYALTNRFVRLLAAGAKPDRIAALTFTRKAAGEFFDEILKKLAQAASKEAYAEKIAGEIGFPALRASDFSGMLRAMVEAMPRLSLGTLDGFFARVVRAFPLELGLGGAFEIMEKQAIRVERRRVLGRMFALAGGTPDAAQKDFVEAFKRATFGAEEKRLGARLDEFLDEHAEIYLQAPEGAAWGRAERIWPEGCPWLMAGGGCAEAAERLNAALPWAELPDGQRVRWEAFFAALPQWAPGADLPEPVKYLLGNALEAWPDLAEIRVERRMLRLPPEASSSLRRLVESVIGAELVRRLEMTRGIFEVLRGYEAFYDSAVRRSGRLTFSDLQRLLRPDALGAGKPLSRDERDEARLFIDWRLDAQIDHWLLDEFQDTSFGQWCVLRNLIDEAVQDSEGRRSFFYVGDVKQAIFAWREGDPRLFREIFDHYNKAQPGTIREERLALSFRSGPAVVAMVNRVFGDESAWRRLFPASAVARWSKEWLDHRSARPDERGYAELSRAADEPARFAATLRIIRETGVLARGQEVAVLVRRNETAAALAEFLRREGGLPVVADSDLAVAVDNPLSSALLALFRAAAHPGDESAWTHLRMTPLGLALEEEGLGSKDALTRRILGQIHAHGFERTSEDWLRRLEPSLAPDDAFSRERGRQFAAAARLFDETGPRDVAEFAEFMEAHTARDANPPAVVRVMTVHKAKGLGFDVVILPDLEGKTLARRREGLAVQIAADRAVEWVLQLPGQEFLERDAVLSAHVEAAKADACYENFCLLYVAMTRARKAMYVIAEPVGRSKSANFPRLLHETLGETWATGDPLWFETTDGPPQPAEPERGAATVNEAPGAAARALRRPSRRPTEIESGEVSAESLFVRVGGAAAAANFGSAVHALLAKVEWLGSDETDRLIAGWHGQGEAGAEARACVLEPGLASVWSRPEGASVVVWREKEFEVVLDGAWVTGRFDRVVVSRDAAGRSARVWVYDFKTDHRPGGAGMIRPGERHGGQLELYRRAAAVLAGVGLEAVSAELILTHSRSVSRPPSSEADPRRTDGA